MNRGIPCWGFTGTRHGMTSKQLLVMSGLIPIGMHVKHGGCVGADEQFHEIARERNNLIEVYPGPDGQWRGKFEGAQIVHPPMPFLVRNGQIVLGILQLLAAPQSAYPRGGTWDAISKAHHLGVPVCVVHRNGSIETI